jgi:hypothetical protein
MLVELAKDQAVACCPLCGTAGELHTNNDAVSQARKPQFWVKCADPACRCTCQAQDTAEKTLARWNHRVVAKVLSFDAQQ